MLIIFLLLFGVYFLPVILKGSMKLPKKKRGFKRLIFSVFSASRVTDKINNVSATLLFPCKGPLKNMD